jgi:hypothetical protein
MTDEYRYDLSDYKDKLGDHEHLSGCPAEPEKIEPEVVRGEDEEIFVARGTTATGEAAMARTWAPGPASVKVRCNSCGVQRLFPVSEQELAGLRDG